MMLVFTRFRSLTVIFLCLCTATQTLATEQNAVTPSIEDFVRFSEFGDAEISPTGKYLAMAVSKGKQTGIAIVDITDLKKPKVVSNHALADYEHVYNVWWKSDDRILFSTTVQQGTLNMPYLSGRLYSMNRSGDDLTRIYGSNYGKYFTSDYVIYHFQIIDLLENDPDWILISSFAHDRERPYAEKLNVHTGRTSRVAISPLESGVLRSDQNSKVRFAWAINDENESVFAYRKTAESDWQKKEFDMEDADLIYSFSKDNKAIIFRGSNGGKKGVFKLDPDTGKVTPMLTDDTVEPYTVIWDPEDKYVVGAVFEDGVKKIKFIDTNDEYCQLLIKIAQAFPGQYTRIASFTKDKKQALVAVSGDILPLEYYLLDTEKLSVDFLFSSRIWLDPNKMSHMQPVQFKARDGMPLHGYLTIPKESSGKNLPLVVIVHGGPHGVRDHWNFDSEVQLLASRGYATLQVNYRGSGGYGESFEKAGYLKWGTAMQDDVTDATLWAIKKGVADPDRICLYGASYGGYATLQGLVREPDLYQCGFAFAGVYDLQLMFEEGDIPESDSGQAYLKKVLGTDEAELAAHSPAQHVDKIKAALYIAHGKEDVRAHVDHFYQLKAALDKADIPYQSLLVEDEGHGFYKLENRVKLHQELLKFLNQNIGPQTVQ